MEGENLITKQIYAIEFSFLMATGDYDTTDFDISATILFIIATMLEIVVLMNVLIAIVSNSYQKVQDDEVLYTYFTRTQMCKEWQYFLGRLYFGVGTPDIADLLFFSAEEEDIKFNDWLSPSTIPPEKIEEETDSHGITQNKVDIFEKKVDYELMNLRDKIDTEMVNLHDKLDKVLSNLTIKNEWSEYEL